jgi:hypothetical protein
VSGCPAKHPLVQDDRGGVTVEAAFAVASLLVVAVLCAIGVISIIGQVRCVDAAREAARLAARGDEASAVAAARQIGPAGLRVELRRDGDRVVARVSGASLLPGIAMVAEAVAALEPGVR